MEQLRKLYIKNKYENFANIGYYLLTDERLFNKIYTESTLFGIFKFLFYYFPFRSAIISEVIFNTY